MNNSVFISYRRSVSGYIARAVYQDLRGNGFDVFMDIESLDSGTFDTIIMNQIAARPYFIVILTPGCVERCSEPGDWLRREIEQAMALHRKIIPLMTPDFKFEAVTQHLTGGLMELPRYSGINIPHDYFEEAMIRLRTRFLKGEDIPVTPAPNKDRLVVQRILGKLDAAPPVTGDQLSAQHYFAQALGRPKTDLDEKIADYTRALQLNPYYADAYINRGVAYRVKGNLTDAAADFNEAIRLNPMDGDAYIKRGMVYAAQRDFDAAIDDFNTAIGIDRTNAQAYYSRGVARDVETQSDQAIADLTTAIRLDPSYVRAYRSRGLIYQAKGQHTQAADDYQRVLELDPQHPEAAKLQEYLARRHKPAPDGNA